MKFLRNAFLLFATVVISSCGGGGGDDPAPTPAPSLYKVGGSVSGLTGSLTLQNNGGESLSLTADGGFTFLTTFNDSANYSVSVATQPTGQACSITSGSGTFNGADITNVDVSCVDLASYNLGGSVTGLTGTVVLRNNGGDNLSVSANGGFTFATPVYDTTNYSVSVLTQPTGQVCSVSNGAGIVSGAAITSVSVSCVTAYTIGGSVSGLTGTVVLQNNNGNNLTRSANGGFSFSTAILNATNYSVSVLTQPTGQICSVSNGSGTVNGSNITTVAVSCVDIPTYSIGGSVSGLTGTVTLQNNGGDNLALSANGGFTFATAIYDNTSYNVSVSTQPTGQICSVSNGSGTVNGSNITTVAVSCADIPTYSIGGSVSGLTGTVVLQNNSGDDLTLSANGGFTFATPINDTTSYSVSVLAQPTGQTCTVNSGIGVLSGSNVTSVSVVCAAQLHQLGGTVTGLNSQLVLQMNGADELTVSSNGIFALGFYNENSNFNITVLTQPIGQTCVVSNGSGVLLGTNFTATVSCSNNSYSVGGSVTGLTGSVTLRNNGGDDLVLNANGFFTFDTTVESTSGYSVSVLTQPAGQTCSVSNANGVIGGSAVTDIAVTCSNVTYTIGGLVSGLSGTVVLQNNAGDDLSINSNGSYVFSTGLEDGASYNVSVESQPTNSICTISNSSGVTGSANVTNVNIICSTRNIALGNLGLTTNSPSIVVMPIHVSDKTSGLSVSGLSTNDFSVLQDGSPVGVESFVSSKPVGDVNYAFRTVVVMDKSSSILAADFTAVKTALQSYVSNLQANQELAIYTFDDTVTLVQNFTSDKTVLSAAVSNIARGNASTNLYGAINNAAGNMNDVFNLNNVVYNTMVVITDGDDTSGYVSKATAQSAVQNKKAYVVPVGSAAVVGSPLYLSLVDIFGESQILLSTDFSVLEATLNTVRNNLLEYFKGLYYVYYASPSRSGSHTIDLSVVGNTNVDTDSSVTGSFSASGFSSVTPNVVISGDALFDGPSITLSAETNWSNDPANYTWTTLDTTGVEQDFTHIISVAQPGDSSSVVISKAGELEDQIIIKVEDLNWSISQTITIDVIVDTDSDGTRNSSDPDDDNDGVLDVNDAFPFDAAESVDTDSDGTGNNADTDDDNDGVLDVNDAFPLDASETVDTDGDGTGNNADTDDDGDGVLDVNDTFPLDASESVDTDGDGIGNNADTDDDNDGVEDAKDFYPLDASKTLRDILNLYSLSGNNGFKLNGGATSSGFSVSEAGDINGDGIGDLIIGAPQAAANGKNSVGVSYVVFGSTAAWSANFDLSTLNGSNGFVLNGHISSDYSGYSVSAAGDVNGDGLGDLIVGANLADPNGVASAGRSYVVFGSSAAWPAAVELSLLNGSNGFVLNGIVAGDQSGISVSAAGDFNGDGIDDLIIGARYADLVGSGLSNAGQSYVVFGSSAAWPAVFELSSLNAGNGFVINGIDNSDYSGYSVSGAGDINGDGLDDLIIGAYAADPNGMSAAGESYVMFGTSVGVINRPLSGLDGSNGFVLNGVATNDLSGYSVSGAGDINNDGIDDLIIGAYNASPNGQSWAGVSYVVFGSGATWPAAVELSSLNGSNGFALNGVTTDDYSGYSVSGAGDVNGDGVSDLIIGAYRGDPIGGANNAGTSYVVFGSGSAWAANIDLALLDGVNGFVLNGLVNGEGSGTSVSGAGDINGDGLDDIIIGAPNIEQGYVVFGCNYSELNYCQK